MNQAGLVVIAMAGLWIAYLVPHRLRYRQQLLESRTDDRFSERLRVLRVAQAAGVGTPGVVTEVRAPLALHRTSARAARGGGVPMDRPHATTDRISADAARRSAAEHAQRAAHLARRGAAARRRALLTVLLLLASAAGWSVVGFAGGAFLLGAVPTALLVTVLGLGRRAVVLGTRADAAWEAGAATRLPVTASRPTARSSRPQVTGRAVHPSEASTEVMARVPRVPEVSAAASTPEADSSAPVVEREASAPTDAPTAAPTAATAPQESTWAPVPVPRPAYTFKAAAPRREPAPWAPPETVATESGAAVADGEAAAAESAVPATDAAPATGGIDLDSVLARRRASGE